jgi:uncharacterized radical SAM superfamily Fe-S cluster-containing enzyme
MASILLDLTTTTDDCQCKERFLRRSNLLESGDEIASQTALAMTTSAESILSTTESVCPECLARLAAERILIGDDVYLRKTCAEHGTFQTIVWRGQPAYTEWVKPKIPAHPANPFTPIERGCPFDCGLCADHLQTTCCVLLEVTQRCDLHCAFCFASAGDQRSADPDLASIEQWYRRLLEAGGPYNIQLSGGEPALRDDLPDIIRLGRDLGFTFFQLNTNGLRLARDGAYLKQLTEAGLSTVFLQFDGTRGEVHRQLRGRDLLAQKLAVIDRCADLNLGVVLVPTLVPGINTDDIGNLIQLALDHFPAVRGVHFQPVSYFGRYPQAPRDADRITIPEVIRAIEVQTTGRIKNASFKPSNAENARCSFHGNFVVMPDGELKPLTQRAKSSCCQPSDAAQGSIKAREFVAQHWAAPEARIELLPLAPQANAPQSSLGGWDTFLSRAKTHVFCISGMAFQDAWNLDLERLRECYIHNISPDGRLIPFCAYNLTDQHGQSLYRHAELDTA